MNPTSLSENLLFTTARIDTVSIGGEKGSGTGFFFLYKRDDKEFPFIVTNKHVVKGASKGGITFHKSHEDKPKLGDSYRLDFNDFESQWTGHPEDDVDIAVIPLFPLIEFMAKQGVQIFFRTIESANIPNEEQLKELDAFEEIVFIGYPNGIWDSKHFLPIMRKGTTATPIEVDYEGRPQFLIDASVFGGSSGSPVYIYQSGTYATKGGPTKVGTKFYFIGVVAAVYFKTDAHEIISLPIPTNLKNFAIDKEMIDLGIVYKAKTVVQAIEHAIKKYGA